MDINLHLFDQIEIAWRQAPKRAKDVRLRIWTAVLSRRDLKALKLGYGTVLAVLSRCWADLPAADRDRLSAQLATGLQGLDQEEVKRVLGVPLQGGPSFLSRCCAVVLLGRSYYDAIAREPSRASRLNWTYLESAELSVLCALLQGKVGAPVPEATPPPPPEKTETALPPGAVRPGSLGPLLIIQGVQRSLEETGEGLLRLRGMLELYQAETERLGQRVQTLQQRVEELERRPDPVPVPPPAPPESWMVRLEQLSQSAEFLALAQADQLTTLLCAERLGLPLTSGVGRTIGRVLKKLGFMNIRVGNAPTFYRKNDSP